MRSQTFWGRCTVARATFCLPACARKHGYMTRDPYVQTRVFYNGGQQEQAWPASCAREILLRRSVDRRIRSRGERTHQESGALFHRRTRRGRIQNPSRLSVVPRGQWTKYETTEGSRGTLGLLLSTCAIFPPCRWRQGDTQWCGFCDSRWDWTARRTGEARIGSPDRL